VTFPGRAPPVNGFWALSIYNEHHFFIANAINRFSVGTMNKDLMLAADGALTIYVQADSPTEPARRANWLPALKGALYPRLLAEGGRDQRFVDAAGGAAGELRGDHPRCCPHSASPERRQLAGFAFSSSRRFA
jgi:hypothetical protein